MTVSKARESFDRILARVEEKKIPLWAHLDITYKCNLACRHCYCQGLSDKFSGRQEELSLSEIERLLDELAQAGSLYLTLSGGEILLHPEFWPIVSCARKKNFCLTLLTNGTLIDEDISRRLAELSPLSVEMSIYGATSHVHDAITRRAGSFQRLVEAVRLLKKYNLKIVLKSVIMEPNFHQAEEIYGLSYRLGADDYLYSLEVSPKNDGSRLPQRYQLGEEKIRYFLSRNIASSSKEEDDEYSDSPLTKPLCGTGSLTCYISPYGEVYPCIQLLISMGNIRKKAFAEIWRKPSLLRETLDSLNTYEDMPLCSRCRYVRTCRKCIGQTYLETMDMRACYSTLKCISRAEYELS